MSERKKRISGAQLAVMIGTALEIAILIPLSLVLHERTFTIGRCCPWCTTASCPWCWLAPYIVLILLFGGVMLALTANRSKAAAPVAQAQPLAAARHRAHRGVSIPPQRKHREHRHRHVHTLRHAKQYDATVSLKQLMHRFEKGATVTIEHLKSLGLIHPRADGYKVLVGDNEKMDRPMTIHATSFSAQAREQIHLAGGQAIKVYT